MKVLGGNGGTVSVVKALKLIQEEGEFPQRDIDLRERFGGGFESTSLPLQSLPLPVCVQLSGELRFIGVEPEWTTGLLTPNRGHCKPKKQYRPTC